MPKLTLQEFLLNRNLLAFKISSPELSGLFSKRVTIPLNTTGLALFSEGAVALFQGGQEVAGKFDLILAKNGEINLNLMFPDLRSADAFPVTASLSFIVSIQTDRADLFKDFVKNLFRFPGSYSTTDLKNFVAPEIKKGISGIVASSKAGELHKRDRMKDVVASLGPMMERFLFGTGLKFERFAEAAFSSPEYEGAAAAEAKRNEEDRRAAEMRQKKEERIRRFAEIMKDSDFQGVLKNIPDEKLQGLIYATLMEDDQVSITAEELVSKAQGAGEEVVRIIYKTMERLLASGGSVGSEELEAENADRIFLAVGHQILEIDPAQSEPKEYKLNESLRSVRAAGKRLLAGSKRALHAVETENGQILDFPLPDGKTPRGGINSIAAWGPYFFATHSEYGLARWKTDRPGEPAELLYAPVTMPNKTTRGVQVIGDRLVFASGMHLFLTAAGDGQEPIKFVSSVESPVTCLTASLKSVFAGTESGAIIGWKHDAPDQPVVVVRKKEPIVNLRLAKISGIPHLFYSSKDLSVRARVVGQNLETTYESGGSSVGVLDAASDYVCASDAPGRKILLWKSTQPTKPAREIDTWKYGEKPILDLWMRKVPAKTA